MHIAALVADGFRNLRGRVPLCAPLAVIVGQNNTGKSNVIDACRLLFSAEGGPRQARWVTPDDFTHDGSGNRTVDVFTLEAELRGLTPAERARMVTCLAPALGADAARIRLRARLRTDDRVDTEWYGGDGDQSDVEQWARDAITYTYLHPLRDATADLRPGRDNRLAVLLRTLAPDGAPDRAAIEKIVGDANDNLAKVPAIVTAKKRIDERLTAIVDGGPFRQHTDLAFADPHFERIVATLRALAGLTHPLELAENGLGYNNLLYIAVLLSSLAEPSDAALRLLLVEEPEAHLHPQLQDLLMRYFEQQGDDATQVIVTSHSPNFASAARVERITVLTRGPDDLVEGRAPTNFGLTDTQLGHLRRFLDVTKAALLFARGVVLVEGVAEQLLVPLLAQRLGRPLWRHGIAVVNVGGVAFPPFFDLFAPDRLPYRCVIISDGDVKKQPDKSADGDTSDQPDADGSSTDEGDAIDDATDAQIDPDPNLSPVARDLLGRQGPNRRVTLASHTLEWDLVAAGNWDVMLDALAQVKPTVAKRLRAAHVNSTQEVRADALLKAVKDRKGRFAQELAAIIADATRNFQIPSYLSDAIMWVTEEPAPPPASPIDADAGADD